MKLTRHNLINILIALAGVIFLGGFLALALPGENNDDDSLDAIAATSTTTDQRVTTSTSPTTATTLGLTTTPSTTATTVKTTATTKKPSTTATTKAPTTNTTAAGGPSGPANEKTDNSASFTHGPDGSFGVSSTDPPGGSDPFRFVIKTAPGSGGVSGDTASVKFTVTITNNTAKSVAFPGGLKIVVTLKTPGGSDVVFNMTASDVTNILPGETITITQERGVSGYGTFDATATCDVDYG